MDLLGFLMGTRYLVLFGPGKYDVIFIRIRYLIGVKSGTYVIFHFYAKIKVNSYESLPLEKTSTFQSIIILNKSLFNKDKSNYYYYKIFLEKGLSELPKKTI